MIKAQVRLRTDSANKLYAYVDRSARGELERAGQFAVDQARRNLVTPTGMGGLSTPGNGYSHPRGGGFPHVATGAIEAAITYAVRRHRSGWRLNFSVDGPGARTLDRGRYPNSKRPPVTAILAWMDAKGIKTANPRRFRKTGANYQRLRRAHAFAIANQIGFYGTSPTYFYTDAVASLRRGLRNGQFRSRKP